MQALSRELPEARKRLSRGLGFSGSAFDIPEGMPTIQFRYLTGLKGELFKNVRLRGSWDGHGQPSEFWSERTMRVFRAEDGCPAFECSIDFPDELVGRTLRWGVVLDGPSGSDRWGIITDVSPDDTGERHRSFVVGSGAQVQDYYLTFARRLGARKFFVPGRTRPDLRFAVWAPHARRVEVVFAFAERGYIADDGRGIDASRQPLELERGAEGIWLSAVIENFDAYRGLTYMYRITTEQGQVRYRTDLFSRAQKGRGFVQPERAPWDGDPATLDGSKSCSVIVGQDTCASDLTEIGRARIERSVFWHDEFRLGFTVPTRLSDLVIYELHLGALAFGQDRPGNLRDGIALLDHLQELGVNAVELLPLNEFSGDFGWGYGDTHHFVIESSAGGLDDYKHFVRECHRRGMAVIQDVCYNHYDAEAERAQWQFDSTLPEHNSYYWYEGRSRDYSSPEGGYVDNESSGWAPRYWEEVVRQQFIASAALLVEECHIDGLRVDLTQAFHRDNRLVANGAPLANVNRWGQKFLREWSRTMRLLRPDLFLIAEDHTGWDKVTESPDVGGLGFTARWDASFYHHLIGDSDKSKGHARVLWHAGFGGNEPLDLYSLAGALYGTKYNQVVYHESHDEAGNSSGTARTLVTAVAGAPLVGATRTFAEARARVVFGLSLFAAGAPLFFMGEEVGACEPYRYDDFRVHREDIVGLRHHQGARLFEFYRQAIALRRLHAAARSEDIDIVHIDPEGRVLAFTRSAGTERLLVVASFCNAPYARGYVVQADPRRVPDGEWLEVLNSDGAAFGGANIGNRTGAVTVRAGCIELVLPANGLLVLLHS